MSANKHSTVTGVRRCRSAESAGDCGRAPCPGHRGRGSPSDAGETPVVVLITQRSQVQILPPTLLPPTLPPLLLPPLPFVQFRGLSQSLGRPSRLGLALLIRVHGRSKPGVTTRALGSDRASVRSRPGQNTRTCHRPGPAAERYGWSRGAGNNRAHSAGPVRALAREANRIDCPHIIKTGKIRFITTVPSISYSISPENGAFFCRVLFPIFLRWTFPGLVVLRCVMTWYVPRGGRPTGAFIRDWPPAPRRVKPGRRTMKSRRH